MRVSRDFVNIIKAKKMKIKIETSLSVDSKACWTLGRWLGFEKRRGNRKFMTRCFTKAQNLRRFYFVIPLLIADDADRNAVISRSADGRGRFQNFLTGAFATEMHLCLPTKLKKQPYMDMEEME